MQTISLDQLTRVTGGACPQFDPQQQAPQGADGQPAAGGGWDQILGGIEQFLGGLRSLLGGFMPGAGAPPDQGQLQPDPQQS